jgi:putative transcriptional regulator
MVGGRERNEMASLGRAVEGAMNKFSRELLQGMNEAADFSEGRKAGARVHLVEGPDVRAIRQQLHMSQQRFAETYRIPLPTLKNWEQGRRAPDAPAAAYLYAISRQPKAIKEALQSE